jgi:hypothetical protein
MSSNDMKYGDTKYSDTTYNDANGIMINDIAAPGTTRRIAMVAHDNKKADLLRWAEYNVGTLREHELYATGTTGTLLEYERTQGPPIPVRPARRRPADRREDRRG